MPSGCARLPSCRKGGSAATARVSGGKVANAAKASAKAGKEKKKPATPGPAAIEDAAPPAIKDAKKGKAGKGGPPPAVLRFLAAKKKAEEAAAAAASSSGVTEQENLSDGSSDTGICEIGSALEFDTFDPTVDDFESMQAFVSSMLDGQEFDSEGLIDLVIAQSGTVGMLIRIAEEDEVYGLMSVTNMSQATSRLCLKQIGAFITDKCPNRHKETFAKAVCGNTGLIINVRMENTAADPTVPLLVELLDEIEDARNGSHKESYMFDDLLILTEVTRKASEDQLLRSSLPAAAAAAAAALARARVQENGTGDASVAEGVRDDYCASRAEALSCSWLKAEDEAFVQCAHAEFEFELSKAPADGLVFLGKVVLVRADKINDVRQTALKIMVDQESREP